MSAKYTVAAAISAALSETSTSSAGTDEVLDGKQFITTGYAIATGTMPNNGALGTITPTTTAQTIPLGYTDGGTVAGDVDLVDSNIVEGKEIFGITGTAQTAQGNAATSNVLLGKTFSNDAGHQVGTMPNNGALGTYTPGTSNQTIPSGYSTGGTVSGDTDLISANIKSGINIFGVNGSVVEATGTSNTSDVLSGATFSKAGSSGLTGTMANNGSLGTITPTTSNQIIPSGFTSGGTVAGSANLLAGNIRIGTNMFGVVGTLDPGTQTGGDAVATNVLAGKTFTNDSGQQSGTMVDRAGDTVALSSTVSSTTLKLRASEGYRDGTNDFVTVTDADFVASNIKSGVDIFGVTGSAIVATGTAVAANVLTGITFSNASAASVSGTMPNRSGDTVALASSVSGTTLKLRASDGYRNGTSDNVTITDADFVSSNIKSGVDIFGVTGSFVGGGIVSYQSGSSGWTSGVTQDFTISAVSTATSGTVAVCRVSISNNSTAATYKMLGIELFNATTVRVTLSTDPGTNAAFFYWEVIEFSNVKSKQTGITNITTANQSITISSVNLSKSIPFVSMVSSFGTTDSYHNTFASRLNSSTSLQILTATSTMTAYWQVIEFN